MSLDIQNLTVYPKNPRAGYRVVMQVTGPTQEVQSWVEHYMQDYPPPGYGTWITSREELPDWRLRVTVQRSDSCD